VLGDFGSSNWLVTMGWQDSGQQQTQENGWQNSRNKQI
jgi:hypothetical protein